MNGRVNTRLSRRGAALVWVALALVLLAGFAALAMDLGQLYAVQAQLQATADAAALAGASQLPHAGAARSVAVEYATRNQPPVSHGLVLAESDIEVGHWQAVARTFTPGGEPRNAMKVTTRRAQSNDNPVQLTMAAALGFREADVAASAIARSGSIVDAIIILEPHADCALTVNGSIFLDAPEVGIQVNSDSPGAFCARGQSADTSAPALKVVSEAHGYTGNPAFDAILQPGSPVVSDPLLDLPEPSWSPSQDRGAVNLTSSGAFAQLEPGYYSGGISANGGSLQLSPGIYVLGGAGLRLRGDSRLVAEGVMFHLVETGAINLRSSGAVTISPPDPDRHHFVGAATYAGISIFQARGNTSQASIYGNSQMELEGRFYFPTAHLDLGGTGDGVVGNQFIADTMQVFGSGAITITYDAFETSGPPVLVQ